MYKTKYNDYGSIERHKARLGYTLRQGMDYLETLSPVANMVTVRCFLSLATTYNWHLDINNVFLYGDLEETVYMKPPLGYLKKGAKRFANYKNSCMG